MIRLLAASIVITPMLFGADAIASLERSPEPSLAGASALIEEACVQQTPDFSRMTDIFLDARIAVVADGASDPLDMLVCEGSGRSVTFCIQRNTLARHGGCVVTPPRTGAAELARSGRRLASAAAEEASASNNRAMAFSGSLEQLRQWQEQGVHFSTRRASVPGVGDREALSFSRAPQ